MTEKQKGSAPIKSVNSQVTDAITQANTINLGLAPAQALGTLYQTTAQSIGGVDAKLCIKSTAYVQSRISVSNTESTILNVANNCPLLSPLGNPRFLRSKDLRPI